MIRASSLVALMGVCVAAGPTTRPSGRPTTRPATTRPAAPARVRDGILGGAIRFLVPAEWVVASRADNGISVTYHLPDGGGLASMIVTQQPQAIPQNDARVRAQLTKAVLDWDNDFIKQRKFEVIEPPKVESDARYLLKVHERYKDGEHYFDVVHVYRAVGLNLVSVMAAASTEDPAAAKAVHEAGGLMLMSVTTGAKDPKIERPVAVKE